MTVVKRVDENNEVIEQWSEKTDFAETTDELGRKYKLVNTEKIIRPDGTVILRWKSCPVGTAVLECGHKRPIHSYDFKEGMVLRCYRCKERRKVVKITWLYK